MKRLASALALILSPLALFALPNYDPFADATASGGTAYAVGNWVSKNDAGTAGTGQKDATGAQWYHAGVTANNSPIITAGNVEYPGLPGPTGNKVQVGNNTAADLATGRYYHSSMAKTLTTGGTASRFYSFVLQASDISGLGTAGGVTAWIAGFNNTGGSSQTTVPTVIGGRTILKAVTGGFQVGLCKATDTPTFFSQTFTTSDKIFIVVEYVVNTGTTSDDVANMWINPNVTTFANNASKPAADLTASSGTDITTSGSLQSFLLGNKANTGLHYVDSLRVAADWAGVTPLPAIQPASITTNYGQTAVFSVNASGSPTYQWQKNNSDLGGQTGSALSLAGVSQANEGSYTVVLTFGGNSFTSAVATLTVNDPALTSGPSCSTPTVPPGSTAVISATAVGSPTLTYQWKKDGGNVVDGTYGGTIITGGSSSSLTISGVRAGALGDGGSYTLSVTNGLGRGLTSAGTNLTVIDPAITSDPVSQTKNYNQSVSFSVTVSGTHPPFTYFWRKNGSTITPDGIHLVQNDSGTTSTLTINNLTITDQANAFGYNVIVQDSALQSTASAYATLTVNDPIIVTPIVGVITNAGATAKLKVQAGGSGSLGYTWKTNGTAVSDGLTPWGSTITGSGGDTLTIAGVTTNDAKTYTVEVSGAGSPATNSGALSVVQVVQQPFPATLIVSSGAKAVFSVGSIIVGPGSLTYQWFGPSGLLSGETGASLTIASATTGNAGSYHVQTIYGAGTALIDSSTASLTITTTATALQNTNLIVVRAGDGAQTLRDQGNTMYLDQFTKSGSYINSVFVPDSGSDPFIARGSKGADINSLSGMSALTVSPDGKYLVLNGYRTNYDVAATTVLGGGSPADQAVPRAVATYDKASTYAFRVSALYPDIAANAYRCATFDGVDEYWGTTGGGTIGVFYFGTEAAAGAVTFNNARIVNLFNGALYVSGANLGIYHIPGKPHPGDTWITDIIFSTVGGSGGCDFALSPDGNTMYVADGRNWSSTLANTNGGIQKYEVIGGGFTLTQLLKTDPDSATGALYVTADFSKSPVELYATTVGQTQNKLVKVVDDGSNSGAGTVTTLAVAGPNQEFRGVRFGPSDSVPRPVLNASLPGAGSTSVTCSWSSVSGVSYRLEYKNDLTDVTWIPVGTVTATGSSASAVDNTSPVPAKRFYRVVVP